MFAATFMGICTSCCLYLEAKSRAVEFHGVSLLVLVVLLSVVFPEMKQPHWSSGLRSLLLALRPPRSGVGQAVIAASHSLPHKKPSAAYLAPGCSVAKLVDMHSACWCV